jgi:amino acid adenylation domain-containing protein
MTLLAAFQTLLGRYTRQEDVLVGSPIAGRTRAATENLIGCFLNILVLRGDLSGDPTFRELLGRVREVALGAYAHQDLPFEHLLEQLQPAREPSYSPVAQVLFILQNAPRGDLTLPGLTLRPLEAENGTAKYDLTLEIVETPDGLRGSLQYDSALFDAATIASMAEHFQTLLASIAADPGQRLSQLPLLTPSERERVVVAWNATASAYPAQTSLVALFEAQVERTPDAVAFSCGGETLTYARLNAAANQLARELRRLGIGPEVLVAVCLERSFQLIVALLGIFKAGGAYVPLDPAYPRERLRSILADSRVAVLLGTERLLEWFPSADAPADVCMVALDRDDVGAAIAGASPANLDDPAARVEPGHLAYVLYTSGSTGQPKGVALEHRQLLNRFAWMWRTYPFAPGEVGCQKTSINFVDSLWEIFGPLLQGVPSVIIPQQVLIDPGQLLETLAAARVTRLWMVPSFLRALLESFPDLAERVPDLGFWAVGGEALSLDLYHQFRERLPGRALVNIYGASEFFDATYYDCRTAEPAALTSVPIGRPLANMQAYVLDAQCQPVPIGVPGELFIGGGGLARGYLHRPDLDVERFIAHPFSAEQGARLYRTGDLARWRADGQLEYLGRDDQQVKIRGFRIELEEIEAALARHPSVRRCVVVAREDPREDSAGERRLVAYVVPQVGAGQDGAVDGGEDVADALDGRGLLTLELRAFLADHLPTYMVPAVIVALPELPLTASGKVNRLALPAPARAQVVDETGAAAPRSGAERELARIWESVLGVAPIGVRDNFFDLGGHSLLAVRMVALVEAVFGVRLPLSLLFSAPTVERLAPFLDGERPLVAEDTVVTLQPGGATPPLFLVHALGGGVLGFAPLARTLGPDQPVYGLQPHVVEPSTDIVAMATHYIRAMRAVQPTGPYALVGHSAGGLIAFEMARQLGLEREQVALLGMLDTQARPFNQRLRELWRPRFAWRLLCDMPGYLAEYLTQRTMRARLDSVRTLSRVLARKLAARVTRQRGARSQTISALFFDARMQQRVAQLPSHYANVVRAHTQAVRNYTPQPYSGHVIVFRARSQWLFSAHEADLGWGRLAQSVTVVRVPGTHATMIVAPHVRVLGQALRERLSASRLTARATQAAQVAETVQAQPLPKE